MRILMLNVLNRMVRNEFECWNNGIAQSHHHSSLNWMTVLRTWCMLANLNDTNLELIGINANSNDWNMNLNDESVVYDQNLLNWMLIKWIWPPTLRNWPGKPILIFSLLYVCLAFYTVNFHKHFILSIIVKSILVTKLVQKSLVKYT